MTVDRVFERWVRHVPDRIALSLGSKRCTYRELDSRSKAIADTLGKRGVRHGEFVGVSLESSFDLVASFIAILRCGAAYLPLDDRYPIERISFMLRDAGARVVLTRKECARGLEREGFDCVLVDDDIQATVGTSSAARVVQGHPDAAAYLMYTSGSTGVPKGAVVPHRGITRLVINPDFVQINEQDVFLQGSPVSFDASTLEIWGALLNGARLVLLPPGPVSLSAVSHAIHTERVSILWLTSGLFNLFMDERPADLRTVRQLLIGGDVLSVRHVQRALELLPDTTLINGYGPTENTTFTCCHTIRRDGDVDRGIPIGRPIRGSHVRIVNEALEPVPAGEPGELLAGGDGVALGYWNRPELTRQSFVPDPTDPTGQRRLYRTGDIVLQREDGLIYFVGRRDSQVKVRGFRIEVEEIEHRLREHPGIRDCAVRVLETTSGSKYLAAYLVLHCAAPPSVVEMKAYAAERLADYMVPSAWAFLDRLPLNPNGKVDRSQLPLIRPHAESAPHQAPALSDSEAAIAAIWSGVLGIERPSVDAGFFDLGGNSLLATLAHERLQKGLGRAIDLISLFQFPTVRSLAAYLDKTETVGSTNNQTLADRTGLQRAALSRFQKHS